MRPGEIFRSGGVGSRVRAEQSVEASWRLALTSRQRRRTSQRRNERRSEEKERVQMPFCLCEEEQLGKGVQRRLGLGQRTQRIKTKRK